MQKKQSLNVYKATTACLLVATLLVGCQSDPSPTPNAMPAIATLDHAGFDELATSGEAFFVLDVRTPQEFAQGHVPGAVNIPHTELAAHMDELTAYMDVPIVTYCERGGRAAMALQTLQQQGFQHLHHLEGDMAGWRTAQRPQE